MRYSLLALAVAFNVGSYVIFKFISGKSHDLAWAGLFACGLALGAVNVFLFTTALRELRLAIAYPGIRRSQHFPYRPRVGVSLQREGHLLESRRRGAGRARHRASFPLGGTGAARLGAPSPFIERTFAAHVKPPATEGLQSSFPREGTMVTRRNRATRSLAAKAARACIRRAAGRSSTG
jgi:hypothetical protein